MVSDDWNELSKVRIEYANGRTIIYEGDSLAQWEDVYNRGLALVIQQEQFVQAKRRQEAEQQKAQGEGPPNVVPFRRMRTLQDAMNEGDENE